MRATAVSAGQATFASLRHRNFRLFFIGQSISNSGNWLTNVAMTLFVLKLAGTGVGVGFLTACQFGPMLFLSAWGGAVADRSDKRRMLLVTQSLEMGQSIALAALAFMPAPPLWGLYALALFGGVLLSLDNPLRRSFVSEMVPHEDLPNAVVLYSTLVNLSRIFGPSLAGVLVVTTGYGWCFTIDALSYVAVIASLIMMRPAELYRHGAVEGRSGGVVEGLRYARSVPVLRVSFAMLAAITMLAYNFTVTLPLFVTRGLGAGEGTFTVIYSVLSFGSVVSALLFAARRRVTMRDVLLGAAGFGFALLLLAGSPGVRTAAAAAFIVGAMSLLYMTANSTVVQLEARPDMRGRMLALQTVLLGASALFGGPLLGWIADTTGGRTLIVIGGLTSLLAAAIGALHARAIRASM
ncbi:MAG: MFS transporter [Acidobacteria bacterium]|nr:MFS transporter [Acidobacteriota bacterium]